MKQLRHFLVATIVSALFFSSLTQRVVALENAPIVPDPVITESAALDPSQDVPVSEVLEKREANVKHFLTDNFRTMAMIYPVSVHYQENGKWKEIDNTLINTVDESQNEVVENKSGGIKIRLAKNSQSTKLVSMKYGDAGLSWTFENIAKKAIRVIQPSTQKDNDLTTVENLTSSVRYLDVFNDVDLEYVLQGDEVKENLILKSKNAERSFTQVFRFNGLTPRTQEDGTISLVDSKGKDVFRLERFLMVDAQGEESQAIATSFSHVGDLWELTIQPDEGWLNDPERVYPVVVDPTVTTPITYADIDDAHVTKTLPTSNFYNSYILKTGEAHRTYLRFTLPHLTAADMVIYASLEMSLANTGSISQNDYQVNVHKVLGDWKETTLTWNNKPSYNPKIEDYEVVGHSNSEQAYLWDVTAIVKDWYFSGNNYGLMLKDNNEIAGYGYKEYYSADTSSTYEEFRPVVTMVYVNNNGLESYWTYHSQNVGRAGTGYTNDFNGNLVFIHPDTVGTGNRMPVSVSHVYNNNDRANLRESSFGDFGIGWRLNVSQQMLCELECGRITYVDDDGTVHYFFDGDANAVYEDESDPRLTLQFVNGNIELNDSSGRNLQFSIKDSVNYPDLYLISQITDEYGNSVLFTYEGARLETITDGAGRDTNFTYDTNGRLWKITDSAGRATEYSYTNGYLTEINHSDLQKSYYTYATSGLNAGNLLSVTNQETTLGGYRIAYTYSNAVEDYHLSRVIGIVESNTGETPIVWGKSSTLTYGNNTTVLLDNVSNTKEIMTFNNDGNTINTRDKNDIATYSNYDSDPEHKNSLISVSKPQKTVLNLLKDTSGELTTSSWGYYSWGGSLGSNQYDLYEQIFGNRSLKVAKSVEAGSYFYQQQINGLTKGKTYTFSAYMKTVGITSSLQKGANLFINYQNSAGTWMTASSKYLVGSQDWQRIEIAFTLPIDAASSNVLFRTGIVNGVGTLFLDALQVEEGPVANAYNLIENPEFRYGTTSWSVSGDTTTVTTTDSLHPTSFDDNVMRINGEIGVNKQFYQGLNISGEAGDSFVLSGWAKSDSAPLSGSRLVALYIRFDYMAVNDYGYFKAVYNVDSTEWQYLSFQAVADKQYKAVFVIAVYSYNVNTAMFDSFALHKENFDRKYTYDDVGNITSIIDLDGNVTSYTYSGAKLSGITDPEGNTTTVTQVDEETEVVTTPDNVTTTFETDPTGNTLSTHTSSASSTLFTQTTMTYSNFGNYLYEQTDSAGNVIRTVYDSNKGTLNSYTDANGHQTTYTYDAATDALLSVSSTVGTSTVTNTYSYTKDRLSTISHHGFLYTFNYDPLGNLTSIQVGNQTMVSQSYQPRTDKLLQTQYANNQTISYDYDSADRISAIRYNGTIKFKYTYDARGNLTISEDVANAVTLRYSYDSSDRLVTVNDSNGNQYAYDYDQTSNVGVFRETLGTKSYTTSYANENGKPKSVTANDGSTTTYGYDALGRLSIVTLNTGTATKTTSYTYLPGEDNSTTDRIESVSHDGNAITYTYDPNGNITQIKEGGKTIDYIYNELNELIRENNERDGVTIIYNYDLGGNLLSKITYPYEIGSLDGLTGTSVNYSYDNVWKDKLISYGGNQITYDALGNPLTYYDSTYTWTMGRQLSSIDKTGLDIDYKYNDAGIRIQKKVNSITTNYHLVGDKVTYESDGTHAIYYSYDAQDKLVSMNLTEAGVSTEYYYIRNGQNDIIGLLDKDGNQVVTYTYTAWGEVLEIDGSLKDTVGVLNPYRYRGYRYDTETGFYYLQSRYYNPQWGRFINADDLTFLGTTNSIINDNLFVYCANSPIILTDPSGYSYFIPVSGFGSLQRTYQNAVNAWVRDFGYKSENVEYGAIIFKIRIGWIIRYTCGPTYKGYQTTNWYTVMNGLILGYIFGLSVGSHSRYFVGGLFSNISMIGFVHSHPQDGEYKPSSYDLMIKYFPGLGSIFAIYYYSSDKIQYY